MTIILKKYFVVLILTSTLSISSSNIIPQEENDITRVINVTKIHCVSESFDVAMFTSPPLQKVQDSENLFEFGKWKNDDDWITMNSSNIISNVMDKRWEDFYLTKTNSLRFNDTNTSVSFSVYGTNEIEIYGDDGESLDYFKQHIQDKEKWTTFTIFFKENHVNYYMNNDYLRKHSLKPTQVVVKTAEDAHFKIHDYNYKEATSITNSENGPTSLTIPPSEKSYLILYIFLCPSCVLDVEYAGQNQTIVSNIKESRILEQWLTYKIKLNPSVTNQVNFTRRKNDKKDGYWKLDARLYNNKDNTVAYKNDPLVDRPEEVYHCKYFQPQSGVIQQRIKRSVRSESSPHSTSCPPGWIGPKCDISCESVLGHQYSQCQQHKICDSMTCQCAWGYHGTHCNKECSDGWWGLDCQQECEHCQSCDKQSGKCTTGGFNVNVLTNGSRNSWIFWCNAGLLTLLLGVGIIEGWRRMRSNVTVSNLEMLEMKKYSFPLIHTESNETNFQNSETETTP